MEIVESRLYTRTMKVSKHIHSCLLVEEQGKTVLVDPGKYSYESKALDIERLSSLDAIAITHEHSDHMYIPWIKEVVAKFPNVEIITNSSAGKILQEQGLQVNTAGNKFIKMSPLPHEKVFDTTSPVENVSVTLFGKMTSVGDSFSSIQPADIVAFPVVAPWGSATQAMLHASKVKTKVMIPIHDYHWKDEYRKEFYVRFREYLKPFGIDFKAVETGEVIEVD